MNLVLSVFSTEEPLIFSLHSAICNFGITNDSTNFCGAALLLGGFASHLSFCFLHNTVCCGLANISANSTIAPYSKYSPLSCLLP